MQASIARAIHGWILRHGLAARDRAAAVADLVATFSYRCSPPARDQDVTDPQGYELAAMFLALFWALDDQAVEHQAGRDMLNHIAGRLAGKPDDVRASSRHPWLPAVSALLDALMGPVRRDVTAFVAAFADHVHAVEEEALARNAAHRATSAPDAQDLCHRIDELLRLRPLLIATEPYVRIWQTVLGLWPAPSFEQAVASLAPDVRRAYPQAGLDRALDRARLAYAKTQAHTQRESPALSELEALTAVLTYVANDLGSLERDRGAGGPEQEPNLVLYLEHHCLGHSHSCSCPWDDGIGPLPTPERAAAIAAAMYNAGVARFQALQRPMLAQAQHGDARRYLSLLARIVDGNLEGMLEHTGRDARARAGAASAREPARVGQATEPRYGAVETLMRLRFIDR